MLRAESASVLAETVLERVLLAIIEANPSGTGDSDRDRLNYAVSALLGSSNADNANTERALIFMLRERQRDMCDLDMSLYVAGMNTGSSCARSVSELAEVAARHILGVSCPKELAHMTGKLCREYRQRVSGYSKEYNPAHEAMQDEAVQRVLDELAEWDVLANSGK